MKEKKIAAAVSAVMAYIKTEEEMATMQAADQDRSAKPKKVPAGFTLWGLSGRQSIMSTRTMMQMKSFHGSKLR
ncbi:MAG: hypothetical protein ABIK15_04585 [Pseudomonadota bacterium]